MEATRQEIRTVSRKLTHRRVAHGSLSYWKFVCERPSHYTLPHRRLAYGSTEVIPQDVKTWRGGHRQVVHWEIAPGNAVGCLITTGEMSGK